MINNLKTAPQKYTCSDCREPMQIPFENNDGKIRCAACAVDFYMKLPAAQFERDMKMFNIKSTSI